jgi:hypothetical protein
MLVLLQFTVKVHSTAHVHVTYIVPGDRVAGFAAEVLKAQQAKSTRLASSCNRVPAAATA